MVVKRSIYPYSATSVDVQPREDATTLSLWFEVGQGVALIDLPVGLARELAGKIEFALAPQPPKAKQQ